MSTIADRIAIAKAESATEEQTALVEIERRLKWIKPAGISARDLWYKLGSRGDVAALTRRLEALREDGGRAVLVGELWYHGSVTLPHIRLPGAAPSVAAPPAPGSVAHAGVLAGRAEERRAQALDLLRAHPTGLKCREVAEHFGLAHTTVYNYLMRLRHDGHAVQDHNGVWRIAPPAPPPPSQITEPPPPAAQASAVEIVSEGEVVAVVPEPDARPDPMALLADLAAAAETIERARREIAEHTADALIGDAFEEIAAYVGAPDYTDPAAVARAVVEREEELTSRLAAAREEAALLRAELERVRAALRTLAAGGGS